MPHASTLHYARMPIHRGIQDTNDLNGIGGDAINDEIRRPRYNKLMSTGNLTNPTALRKVYKP